MPAILVDTNVLVYAYDRSEPVKQKHALVVLDAIAQAGVGVLCAQVLSEFFNTITRKIAAPLSIAEAYERLENYCAAWTVLDLTHLIILKAAPASAITNFLFGMPKSGRARASTRFPSS